MTRIVRILVLAALGISAGRISAEDPGAFKVIVNPANPATQITRLKIGEIFLRKEKRWPDGQSAVPVEPSIKSPVRQRFDQDVYGKPVIAISAYWQQMIFGGKGIPPPEKSSDAEVVSFVRETAGAIGYVSAGADASGVKVVAIVD
ncbi:MAG TPA: phosphate ABC transporter substrate-binding protein [Thermoanaerobaculia bacterium]|nr:phosphate ABC transporter substrate-binding protein [Thermoanaerobaculia bacterium]